MKVFLGAVLGGTGAPLLLFGLAWLLPLRDIWESRFVMGLVYPFAWFVGLNWALLEGNASRVDSYLQQEAAIVCYLLGTCLLVALLGAIVALLGAIVGGAAGGGLRKVAQKS